jgi:hypothetical protein
MAYLDASYDSRLAPKLLGIYERELTWCVRAILARAGEVHVVGAAEGYYAVGLLRRWLWVDPGWVWSVRPNVVHAYEVDEKAVVAMKTIAGFNRVDRLLHCHLGRVARTSDLRLGDGGGGGSVICDVEGDEVEVLDDPVALRWFSVLVEVHENWRPGTTALLTARFQRTHNVVYIKPEPRTAEEYPFPTLLRRLAPKLLAGAIKDRCDGAYGWLWMTPRAGRGDRAEMIVN